MSFVLIDKNAEKKWNEKYFCANDKTVNSLETSYNMEYTFFLFRFVNIFSLPEGEVYYILYKYLYKKLELRKYIP